MDGSKDLAGVLRGVELVGFDTPGLETREPRREATSKVGPKVLATRDTSAKVGDKTASPSQRALAAKVGGKG